MVWHKGHLSAPGRDTLLKLSSSPMYGESFPFTIGIQKICTQFIENYTTGFPSFKCVMQWYEFCCRSSCLISIKISAMSVRLQSALWSTNGVDYRLARVNFTGYCEISTYDNIMDIHVTWCISIWPLLLPRLHEFHIRFHVSPFNVRCSCHIVCTYSVVTVQLIYKYAFVCIYSVVAI